MKKKLVVTSLIMCASLIGIFSLNAANNRIEIVKENYASKQLSNDGMHITNVINKANTDLVNGNVAIEIIIDNSKHTEIFYAIDNGKTISSIKGNIIDTLKTQALALEEMDNIKQGVITTTDGEINLVPLDTENIEMQLDTVKNMNSSTKDGEVFDSIDKAVENFSENADERIIVVTLSSTGTDITGLKEKIEQYAKDGIKIIVYGINLDNQPNFQNIFGSLDTKYELTTDKLNEINYVANIMSYIPEEKPAIATTISFDSFITDNFEIKDLVASTGQANLDNTKNEITWGIGNMGPNQVVKLTYYLSLKNAVDESVIEKLNLRTNRQIIVTQSGREIGTYPKDDLIEDQECSPVIKILREAIDNPKTGIVNYVVFGACLLSVALIGIVILNSKSKFNRI